jgi:uncharacterized protein
LASHATGQWLLRQGISAANQERPHLTLLTGDFVTKHPEKSQTLATELRALRAEHGVFAVLGNHDRFDKTLVRRNLEDAGIVVLQNEERLFFAGTLRLVALGDLISGDFQPTDLFANDSRHATAPPPFVLAMTHHPDCSDALMPYNVSLMLAGHTHGGQVRLPGLNVALVSIVREIVTLGPLRRLFGWRYRKTEAPYYKLRDWSRGAGLLPLDRNTPMTRQLTQLTALELSAGCEVAEQSVGVSRWLNINVGLGSHVAMGQALRWHCGPEIVVVTLRRASYDGAAVSIDVLPKPTTTTNENA